MSNPLEDILKDKITREGPLDVGAFMTLALGHPEYGYYMSRDPFGREGDFTTAPEVSQLFGEMLGAWVADIWLQMGQPEQVILLECGPGRGTLMADMMRATKNVAGFHAEAQIHLLEISPVLKARQGEALAAYAPRWHESLEDVPSDAPMIVIGNEFLDALPFRQFVKTSAGREERKIGLQGDRLVFMPEGDEIVEDSPERNDFARDVCARLKAQGGAALFIDYGHIKSGVGDTFQALKGHEYVDTLSHIWDADLTSHVDFEALAAGVDLPVSGPVEQGCFLQALGIGLRAAALMQNADARQREMIEKGLHRLCDSAQMGTLFKVIAFHDSKLTPAGF